MKKTAILTWLHNGNYGSILQAYALQKYLRNVGLEVCNIDLQPSVIEKIKNLVQQRNSLILFKEKWLALQTKHACKDKNNIKVKEQKFYEFLQNNFNLTRKYRRFCELKELAGKFDVYICGSDQIWSPMLLSPSYYFDFLDDCDRKIAYACSFGMDSIPSNKCRKISEWINRYNAISVREISGQKIVKQLTNINAVINVDPVMLLDAVGWDELLVEKPIIEGRYLFCYFLSYNKEQWRKSLEVAKDKRLKVVVVPTTKETYNIRGVSIIENAGPEDWVNFVKYATLIATDSFHGCVFSILYRRQFMVFRRFADTDMLSQNSRIYTLLDSFELKKCLVDTDDSYEISSISDNEYDNVIAKVFMKAEESKNWLKKSLGQ